MGYFDIKLSLIKVASGLGGSKDDQFFMLSSVKPGRVKSYPLFFKKP